MFTCSKQSASKSMSVILAIIVAIWWAIIHWYIVLPVLIVFAIIGAALEKM